MGSGVVSVVAVPVNPTARPSLFSDTPGNNNNNYAEYISILGALSGQGFDVNAGVGRASRGIRRNSGMWVVALALVLVVLAIGVMVMGLGAGSGVSSGSGRAGVAANASLSTERSVHSAAPGGERPHSPVAAGSALEPAVPAAEPAPQPLINPALIETLPDGAAGEGRHGVSPPGSAEARAASLAVAESLRKLNEPAAADAPKAKVTPSVAAPASPRAVSRDLPRDVPRDSKSAPDEPKPPTPSDAPPGVSETKRPSPSGPVGKGGPSARDGTARDPDVDLILALMRHSDSAGPARSAGSGTSVQAPSDLSIASLVSRCKTLAGVDAKSCQKRICAGYWGRAEACPTKDAPKKAPKKKAGPGTPKAPDSSGAASVSGSPSVSASAK